MLKSERTAVSHVRQGLEVIVMVMTSHVFFSFVSTFNGSPKDVCSSRAARTFSSQFSPSLKSVSEQETAHLSFSRRHASIFVVLSHVVHSLFALPERKEHQYLQLRC
jgi:hypothetical protein